MTAPHVASLANALRRLVGPEATVFILGTDPDEPEGDVYIASDAFAELLLQEMDRSIPMTAYTREALIEASRERARQVEKWGDQSRQPDSRWLAILMEEVGESAQVMLDATERPGVGVHPDTGSNDDMTLRRPDGPTGRERLRDEVTQVAAVALAWLEALLGARPPTRQEDEAALSRHEDARFMREAYPDEGSQL